MPAPDAHDVDHVIDAVSYNVTRDDLIRSNLWLQDRMPTVVAALRRRRRTGITAILLGFVIAGFYIASRAPTTSQQPMGLAASVIFTLGIYVIFVVPVIWFTMVSGRPILKAMAAGTRRSINEGHFDHATGECTILITDDLITCDQQWQTMRMPWAWCEQAQFAPDAVHLYFDRLGSVRVPLRAFADNAHRDRFVQAIVDRLPERVRAAALAGHTRA
jgi:hypothetical protein